MTTRLFPATERGHITWDWLDTYHSFSFGHFYRPDLMGFGALRVVNDDTIAPGSGFDTHSHANMEIITLPLSGAVEHVDNTGAHEITPAGSVQVMSAGSFVAHSEKNASESVPLELFQIWIETRDLGIPARYAEKAFDPKLEEENWQLIVSPDSRNGSLMIHQDAFLSLRRLGPGESSNYTLFDSNNGVYCMVIDGEVIIEGENLKQRDAIGVTQKSSLSVESKTASRILAIEIPMNTHEG